MPETLSTHLQIVNKYKFALIDNHHKQKLKYIH